MGREIPRLRTSTNLGCYQRDCGLVRAINGIDKEIIS